MSRRLFAIVAFIAVAASPAAVTDAFAQSESLTPIASSISFSAVNFNAAADQSIAQMPREVRRPASALGSSLVMAMHATTVLAQALDVHSTITALDAGAVEANPLMTGVVKNRAAFIGVKAAVGAGLLMATHKMARRNRVAAVLTAAAANTAYFLVAHHNYKVARGLR